jgi:dTMP kinase
MPVYTRSQKRSIKAIKRAADYLYEKKKCTLEYAFQKTLFMDQKRGLFITFEGGEGTGKSTQMKEVAHALSQRGIAIDTTREPGGSPLAESLRSLFLQDDLHTTEEMLLVLASRHHHIRTRIQPALDKGQWVLCDRFMDSSIVYQGLALGQDTVMQWHNMACIDCMPDMTFLLQDPKRTLLEKRTHQSHTNSRFDKKSPAFHERIHQDYVAMAEKNAHRFIVVPPEKSIAETTHFIVEHIEKKWKNIQ